MAEVRAKVKVPRSLMRQLEVLRRLEIFIFWLVVAPLVARLPAKLAYGAATRRGDWIARNWPEDSVAISRNLRQVLGETPSSAEVERMTREVIRTGSYEVIDLMMLRNQTRPLKKLVEIRGLEHLEAAKAEGKGAILCTAHFGSYEIAWSLIHASGFPVTAIGHWWWDYLPDISPVTQRFWSFAHKRRLLRYRQRPNIEPWSDRMSAMKTVGALRRNEVAAICIDAFALEEDKAKLVKVPLLGREATFLPGVISLARLSGAPILMMFMHRSEDHRHQVLEISAPISIEGGPETAFRRCVAAMDAAIRVNPAHWHYFSGPPSGLAEIGLGPEVPAASSPGNVPVA